MRLSARHAIGPTVLAVLLVVAGCSILGGGGDLVGPTWQWTASTTTVPASQSVTPDPENYTITFASDGTYSAKADCNSLGGSYTTSGSSITIEAGPSTLVACPEGSQADVFTAGLFAATSYSIADDELTLTTADGTMTFSKASS
jgi:heat shock protein HslJ